jgi:hypothetical protein
MKSGSNWVHRKDTECTENELRPSAVNLVECDYLGLLKKPIATGTSDVPGSHSSNFPDLT